MPVPRSSGLKGSPSLVADSGEPVRSKRSVVRPSSPPFIYETEVRVLFKLTDLSITYVVDNDAKKYFIDSDSDVGFATVIGQILRATVNRDGYVLAANLLNE